MIVIDDSMAPWDYVHADRRDNPLCGAKPEGAFLSERLSAVTCPVCLAVAHLPMSRLVPSGAA